MTQSQTTLRTHGIKCGGCESAARAAVERLPGVSKVEFDLPGKTATITHDSTVPRADLVRAMMEAGFPSD